MGRLGGLLSLLIFAGLAFGQTEYAGSAMCQVCHEEVHQAFRSNPHWTVETDARSGWENNACESCHGSGVKHTESLAAPDILNPGKLATGRADAICLSCHQNQPTQVGRIQGSHARNQVSCVSCHPIHAEPPPKSGGVHRQARINQQCSTCHTVAWAEFQRPHAHRLPEGAMSCVDCHSPHGSFLANSMRTVSANEPGCLGCHGDKRGPFVFEHAPVRLEGCASCHEPHGSANPRMLTRARVSDLCLECHSNIIQPDGTTGNGALGTIPPGFHDLRSARFQNCTICHVKVHGSHVSRELLR